MFYRTLIGVTRVKSGSSVGSPAVFIIKFDFILSWVTSRKWVGAIRHLLQCDELINVLNMSKNRRAFTSSTEV